MKYIWILLLCTGCANVVVVDSEDSPLVKVDEKKVKKSESKR